ncbi:sugar transferase [Levilactobacillus namurensis]|uniref:sugar transferase n=1 Tax=Levilactobacillus namurensis TaxID=380393 RepID=UPI002230F090|nr:sugar transferase [Levilactobacillus namurensis]MCW3778101.1 sugar transferase [Levilactobacillus namurensis]MDT7018142.1 sugar transferase [Levilactobacillus namurensis]WNN64869.1 sugar transferase [Levilactobacillus namurensis]
MEYSEGKVRPVAVDTEYQQHRYGYRVVKRVFDFIASLIGLILLSPVFLIVAVVIKIENPHGPIFLRFVNKDVVKSMFYDEKFRV